MAEKKAKFEEKERHAFQKRQEFEERRRIRFEEAERKAQEKEASIRAAIENANNILENKKEQYRQR